MNHDLRRVASWLPALAVCLVAASATAAPDPGGVDEDIAWKRCPWVPRSGAWRLEVGKLSVNGSWTPLGGNFGGASGPSSVRVTVEECGERIIAEVGGNIGRVKFLPARKKLVQPIVGSGFGLPKVAAAELQRREQVAAYWAVVPRFEENGMQESRERPLLVADGATFAALALLSEVDGRARALDLLREPPAELSLFGTGVYRAAVTSTGRGGGSFEWYLDYVTQYEMFSFITFGDPTHQQFIHWIYRDLPDEEIEDPELRKLLEKLHAGGAGPD